MGFDMKQVSSVVLGVFIGIVDCLDQPGGCGRRLDRIRVARLIQDEEVLPALVEVLGA